MDTRFNIIDIKKLIPKMKHLVPNVLLIFSIGVVIILLLLSVKFTDLSTIGVMSSFYFTLHPCNSYESFIEKNKKNGSSKGIEQTETETVINVNEKEAVEAVIADFKEDYCEKRDLEDLEGIQPLLYVCRAAYLVSSNMSNTIIKGLYNILNLQGYYSVGVLILYLGMFFLLKFLRELINKFIPKTKVGKAKSSFIFDIFFSIFSIITVLYVVCLVPTVITYLMYLMYGVVFSDGVSSTNVIRPMFFIIIVIIPIALWLVGANLNIREGITNPKPKPKPKPKVKCGDYNWLFYIGFVLLIPVMACLKQIPFLIINGINGMKNISKMKTETPEQREEKANLLIKIRFVYAYGIIIFIGMIILPIIIHMLRNISRQINFKFLTDFLNKLEDVMKIK